MDYRMLFEQYPVIFLLIDPVSGKVIDANQAAVDYYGYSKDELLAMKIQEINILTRDQVEAEMHQAEVEHRNFFRFTHRKKDGSISEMEVHSYPIDLVTGRILFSMIYKSDDRGFFDGVSTAYFDESSDAILILDHAFRVIRTNPGFSRLFGFQEEDVLGKTPEEIFALDAEGKTYSHQLMNGRVVKVSSKRLNAAGDLLDVEMTGIPLTGRQHFTGAYLSYRDISDLKDKEREIQKLAYLDRLTQLYNRNYFLKQFDHALKKAQAENRCLGLLYMDLNGFKSVNDTWGHEEGDRVLVEFAARIRQLVRQEDVLARYGGDEFALLTEVGEKELAIDLAERLIEVTKKPYTIQNMEVKLGISIGVVSYPDHESTVEGLLHQADMAMYAAKRSGKNAYYSPGSSSPVQSSSMEWQGLLSRSQQNDFKELKGSWISVEGKAGVLRLVHHWPWEELNRPDASIRFYLYANAGIAWTIAEWMIEEAAKQAKKLKAGQDSCCLLIEVDEALLVQDRFQAMAKARLSTALAQGRTIYLQLIPREQRLDPEIKRLQLKKIKELGFKLLVSFTRLEAMETKLLLSDLFDAVDLQHASEEELALASTKRFIRLMAGEGLEFWK